MRHCRLRQAASQQQQQQQLNLKQQAEEGSRSSASLAPTGRHLPHPQLVSTVLGLAKQHYARFTDPLEFAQPSAAAASTAATTARALQPCVSSAASTRVLDAQSHFVNGVQYQCAVTELVEALGRFIRAPQLGQQPAARAWRDVLGMRSVLAALVALNQGMLMLLLSSRRAAVYACTPDAQYRQAALQHLQELEDMNNQTVKTLFMELEAAAKTGLDVSQLPQGHQQSGTTASEAVAAQQAVELPRTPHKPAKRNKRGRRGAAGANSAAAAAAGLAPGLCMPLPVLEACCAEAGSLCKLLSAFIPSRHTCNGPQCTSLATVSESFALVRVRACVCGCSVARHPADNPREVAFR
jgi:hypothetical protein